MQPQFSTLLTIAEGTSVVTDDIFDNRFRYANELRRMGADITVEGTTAVIQGVSGLNGAAVRAPDLRAGIALVIAGLMANGTTVVENIYHIGRGYENIEDKLMGLGADIVRVREYDTVKRTG